MNRIILIALLLILGFKPIFSQLVTPPPKPFNYQRDYKPILMNTLDRSSNLYYHKLLKRFLDNDSALAPYETLALMIGYTVSPDYKPLEDMKKELEIFEHNKNAEFRIVIEKSKPYLKTHPLSLLINREISFAYNRLKIFDSANYYMTLNDKIMEAMIYSGRGKSPDNPIFSLGLADGEYFLPNVGMGMEAKEAKWNKKGEFMEIIRAVDDYAVTGNFYFMIQHAKQKMDDDKATELAILKALKEKEEKERKAMKKRKNRNKVIQQVNTDSIPPPLIGN